MAGPVGNTKANNLATETPALSDLKKATSEGNDSATVKCSQF